MAENVKKKNSMMEYFKGVKTEMKKVIWPTRKETYNYTGVVILTCFAFSLFFFLLDTGFLKALEVILNITLK